MDTQQTPRHDYVSDLYDALIESGKYDASELAGNKDNFRNAMSSKETRKAMYDWIASNEDFDIGPYDTYEVDLASSYDTEAEDLKALAAQVKPTTPEPQKPQTISEQYDRESVGEQLWQPFAKTNEEVEYTPSPVINAEEADKVGAPLSAMDKAVYTANTQALLDNLKASNKATEKRLAGIGDQSPTLTEEVVQGEDGPTTIYHTPDGRTFNNKVEATLSMEDTARAIETKSVEGLEQRLARLDDAANERREAATKEWQDDFAENYEAAKKGSLWDEVAFAMVNTSPQSYASSAMARVEGDPEYRAYNAAKVLTEGTINMIREAEKSMADGRGLGAWTKAVGRGFGDTFADPRTWDLGVGDLLDSTAVLEAAKAFDEAKGDMSKLTPAQRELLNAMAVDTAYRAMYEDAISSGYTAGSVTAAALPFIAQMMLGGSNSVSQLVTKGAYKGALKAAFMTGTFGTGTSLADANRRMTGNATPVISESGEIVYGGREGAEDAGTALRKAYTNTFIEYYSEMLGGSMGDAVDALADVTGVTSLMKKAFKNLPKKTVAPIAELIKSGQWHGLFGEYAEEVAGGALNAALVGDVTTDDLLSMDYHKETLEGLLPMSIAFGILSSTSYRTQGYIARKNLRAAQDALRAQGINSIDDLHLTTENTLSQIEEVANNDNFSIAQKQAIITYLKAEQAVLETEKGQQAAEELMSEENITLGRDLEKDLNIGIAAWNSSLDGNNEQVEQIKSEYEEARAQFDEKQLAEMDQLTNNELFEYLNNHKKQARTIWDYLRKRQRYIAIDMAEKDVARAEEKIGAEIEMGRAQGAAISPEEVDAKGAEAIAALDEISSQLTAKERNDLDSEGISATRKATNPQAAEDYLSAKAYVEGMYEGARAQADAVAQKAAAEVQSRTHAEDGQIYTATTNGGESVNVVRGKITLNADGTIDLGASDKGITIVDEAGNKKMISSRELKSLEVANGAEAQQVASEAAKQTYLEKLEALFNAPTPTQLEQQAAELEEEQMQMDAANRAVQQAEIINGSNVAIEVNGMQYPGQVMIVEDGGAVVDFGRPIIYNGRRSRTHQIPVNELTNLDAIARETESQASAEQPQAQTTPDTQGSASLAEQPVQEEVDYDALLERDPAEFLDKYDAEVGTEVAQGFMKGLIEDTRKAVKAKQTAMKKAVKSPNQYVALKREADALQGRLELLEEVYDKKYNSPQEAVEETASPESPEVAAVGADEQAANNTIQLSDEIDENGKQFVLSPSGDIAFGFVTDDTGLTPAPILLSEGMITNPATNDGYGLVHIEARHGAQIRQAGYTSVIDFINEVAKNYETIREGNKRGGQQTYMLQLTDKHNNTLMVELSGDGTYWNINTAGVFKTSYGKNKKVVYNRQTTGKQFAETVGASQGAEQSGTQTPSSLIDTPTPSVISDNKDNTLNEENQISEQENISPVENKIAEWSKKVGVPVSVYRSVDEIPNAQARAAINAGQAVRGWYERSTGAVAFYLPNLNSEAEVDEVFAHEVVSHKGLRGLLGQEKFDALCDKVWDMMSETDREFYMNYPGVNGDKRAAADEYMAHLAEKVDLTNEERTIWQSIVDFIKKALLGIKVTLSDKDIEDLIRMSYREMRKGGEDVSLPTQEGEQALFSISTYEQSGREKLAQFVKKEVKSKRLTQQEGEDLIKQMDALYKVCVAFKDKYEPFGNWSDAAVVVDEQGKPVFSVIKANGDYAMNLDFSLVCKKRRTLDAVFRRMIDRGIINNYELGQVDLAKINQIIREHGFETACRLCFVDAKRFRVAQVADAFCDMYNPLTKMSDKQLREVSKKEGNSTIGKTAHMLLKHPENKVELSRENFMDSKGFEDMAVNSKEILKLYNAKKGTGGPKASYGDTQYMNDILGKKWTPESAYAVGGVRLQSFSDYVPRMVFDYMQMVADIAAKKLPVHSYTKEPIFAKQFGLTGIKINLSLVPRVEADGIAPGLDAEGNYVWQEGETYPYEEAIAIQNADGYKANCGTIAVGVSDAHIEKMLSDENIRMVIPYHKSGLNLIVAQFNNIDAFKDYTNEQNTRNADGTKLDEKQMKSHFNFNADLHEHGDPRKAAQNYLEWCDEMGYIPKFDKFRGHPNYYKLLEDFTTCVTENGVDTFVPQGPVTMTFPDENSAFGSIADLIEQGLEEDAVLEGNRQANLDNIVDDIVEEFDGAPIEESEDWGNKKDAKWGLRFSVALTPEEQAIVDKAKADGTYLKAPNGKATNLSPKQWAQVRTEAFKKWLGDWEKAARIEKLRNSKSAEITGAEFQSSEDMKQYRQNALEYGKTFRGAVVNADTGSAIVVNTDSVKEVLHHDGSDIAHIQSVAAIPEIIKNGIYITTEPVSATASKRLRNAQEVHYYVCGLNIGGTPYTVKFVVAEFESGEKYYDHSLTQIEKGDLLNRAEVSSTVAESKSPISDVKDKRLLSILQTNSSKIIDENGEPKVVWHGGSFAIDEFMPNTPMHFGTKTAALQRILDTQWGFDNYDISQNENGKWSWKYTNPDDAGYDKQAEVEFDSREEAMADAVSSIDGVVVKPYFLNLRNPQQAIDLDADWSGDIQSAKENGFDGLIYMNDVEDPGSTSYVAFEPNQIKSATENVGTFDAENNDIRFSIASMSPEQIERGVESANSKQKIVGQRGEGIVDDIRFSIGRNRQEQMYNTLGKRRPELTDQEKKAVIAELDKIDDNKVVNAAFHYFANGTIRIPEDMPKVEQAVKVASIAKVDPAAYRSPMELIDAHADIKIKDKRIDPDTVPTLSNKVDYGNGITVYDVEESQESRENMRKIINTHFGEESSPWCLLQGDGKGHLTPQSEEYWEHYSAYPKRVAFKDGKLSAFFASADEPTWWSRQDKPYEGIPVVEKLPDGSGRVGTTEFDEDTREYGDYTDIRIGERGKSNLYEEWEDEDTLVVREVREGDTIYCYEYVDGEVLKYAERYASNYQARKFISFDLEGGIDTIREQGITRNYNNGKVFRVSNSSQQLYVTWGNKNQPKTVQGAASDNVYNRVEFDSQFNEVAFVEVSDENQGKVTFNAEYGSYHHYINGDALIRCSFVEDGKLTYCSWSPEGALRQYREDSDAIYVVDNEIISDTEGTKGWTMSDAIKAEKAVKEAAEQRTAELAGWARDFADQQYEESQALYEREMASAEERNNTRFSVATTPSEEQYSVKEAYDNRLSKRRTKLREEMMDDGIAIKILQDLIAQETGEPIADIANVYLHRNHMNSRSTQEIGYYEQKFGARIMEALRRLIKSGAKLKDIEKYLIAKHGLERNDYMNWREAVRKAAEQKRKKELKDYDNLVTTAKELGLPKPESKVKSVGEYEREYFAQYNEAIANLSNEEYTARRREIMNSIVPYNFSEGRDQSGLTETLGYDPEKEDAVEYDVLTEEAHRIVEQFESEYNTAMIEELWDSIKASAGFSLTKNRNTGQISNEYHDNASKMYRYYVPLRGWEKNKAEDVYAYEDVPNTGTTNRADLKAAGRRSKPDSPFATLANMAYTAIVQGNKNRANMSLLNLARMYPSDALSVHRIWEVLDEDTGDWVVAEPKLTTYNAPRGESSNEALKLATENGGTVAADLAAYEEKMKALQKEGKARPVTGKIDSHLHFTNQQLKQHAVTVRVNGTPYIVWVNGNPRVAQTLNGLTRKHLNAFERGWKAMTRWLSGVFTSKNPAFWVANGSRDLWYSEYRARTMFGMEYATRYTKNYGIVAAKIWELQRNGQLNAFEPSEDMGKIQQYYNEFIRNGGPTGYAYLKDVQELKGEMQTALKDMEKSVSFKRGWEKFDKNMDAISGAIETIPRLAAYITSRESGRSILDSISDAKEVTTNFDRKGGRLNQSFGVAWAFFNASVQGVQNFLNTVKEHPVKATMEIAGRAALGVYGVNILNMALAALFGDDPDEVMDQYFALSDYTRRHNLCFYIGGDWVKIPLPQTLRVFYGIGDIINKATHGYAHYDNIPADIASLLGDFFPINLVGAEDWRSAVFPTALSPLVEVFYTNTDYMGMPIANQTIFNKHLPEWQRTYGDESAPAVLISRALSKLSGGSKYKRGKIEFNPAYIDHLVKGYLGGVGTFITKGANTIEWGAKELAEKVSGGAYQNPEEFMWRGTPISSRLLQDAPTGDNNFRLNQAYSYWRDFYEEHNTQKKGYEDELESGNLEDVDDFIKVMMDEGTMEMFHDLDREIRKLYKEKDKMEDPDAVASVNELIKTLKQRAVQMMEDEYFSDKKKPVFQERLREKDAKRKAEEKKRKASEE